MADMTYAKKVGIAVDQLANTLCGGWPDNTLSSRAYLWHTNGVRTWPMRVLDCLFFWDSQHCYQSYLSELERKHLPPEMRG